MLLAFVVIATGGSGFWAGQQFSGSDQDLLAGPTEPVTAEARAGSLSETYPVPVSVEWAQDLSVPFLGDPGVVTSLGADPDVVASVDSGAVIGAVDGQPIVIIEGQHPAYRTLEAGTTGPDVAQLQDHLVAAGLLSADASDGTFGSSTADAVEAWWETLGITGRTAVPRGSVIFVADLPRLLTVDSAVQVGGLIAYGANLVIGVSRSPVAIVTLTELQERRFLAEDAEFSILDPGGGEIKATVSDARVRDFATEVVLTVSPDELGQLSTSALAPGRIVRLSGRMTITAPVEGTVVPAAALGDPSAPETTIRLVDGSVRTVTVIAVVGGEAVVDPLEPGVTIVIGK